MLSSKITTVKELREKSKSKTIIMCHGTFDLIHIGHLDHLLEAKKYADLLVVSLTTDKFIKKGPNRPLFKFQERAYHLSCLEFVDFIIPSNSATAIENIISLKPNFYCKGIDYKKSKDDLTTNIIHEMNAAKKCKSKVIITETKKLSSSNIINLRFDLFSDNQKLFLSKIRSNYSFKTVLDKFQKIEKIKVAVIGETIFDKYNYGLTLGKSGKDPFLTMLKDQEKLYPGGSLAIANTVGSFVNNVTLYTNGSDENDYKNFLNKFRTKKLRINFLKNSKNKILKERFIDLNSNVKLLGYYHIEKNLNNNDSVIKKFKSQLNNFDVVIIADYGHHLLDHKIIESISSKSKFLAINVQKNSYTNDTHTLSKYQNCNLIIINETELRSLLNDDSNDIYKLSKLLRKQIKYEYLIVTSGKDGARLFSKNKNIHVPSFSDSIIDKVGTGDTMLAIISIFLFERKEEDLALLMGSLGASHSLSSYANSNTINKEYIVKSISHLIQ